MGRQSYQSAPDFANLRPQPLNVSRYMLFKFRNSDNLGSQSSHSNHPVVSNLGFMKSNFSPVKEVSNNVASNIATVKDSESKSQNQVFYKEDDSIPSFKEKKTKVQQESGLVIMPQDNTSIIDKVNIISEKNIISIAKIGIISGMKVCKLNMEGGQVKFIAYEKMRSFYPEMMVEYMERFLGTDVSPIQNFTDNDLGLL